MSVGVCLFTDSLEPSGLGEHMLALAAELRSRYQISFVCSPTHNGSRLLQRASAMGLQTLALPEHDRDAAWYGLGSWLSTAGITIFHHHAGIGWEGLASIDAARAAGVPVVIRTEHLPYTLVDPVEQVAHGRMVQRVDRLICVSEEARLSFAAVGARAEVLSVVRNGITPGDGSAHPVDLRQALSLPPESRLVMTVARFQPQKGYEYLLDAIPAILEREPAARFIWVGDGPLRQHINDRVHARGLDSHVHFLGQRTDVPELLLAADLFVLPSLFEGLPLVVLEAMAAKLPVVGTQVCGTREAVDDGVTGRLVPAADPAALAAAVADILGSPELAARFGAAGRTRVLHKFSARRMGHETAALYDELLAAAQSWPEQSSADEQLVLTTRGSSS